MADFYKPVNSVEPLGCTTRDLHLREGGLFCEGTRLMNRI
jgi:hypothetical protein